jgi:hypothetical protein
MNSPPDFVLDGTPQIFKFPRPRKRPKQRKGPWTEGPEDSQRDKYLFQQLELPLGDS